ncbi:MAG: hypothetical protein EA370_13450 [Wenzhouxiangella sp.]|nr:MAG: hypothetical protein EA370_13450 [Wenzhouxiangella sp.]
MGLVKNGGLSRGLGFGLGQSANLRRELDRSLSEPIPDWRWLAAAGIRQLGRGDSRRLLAAYSLDLEPTV